MVCYLKILLQSWTSHIPGSESPEGSSHRFLHPGSSMSPSPPHRGESGSCSDSSARLGTYGPGVPLYHHGAQQRCRVPAPGWSRLLWPLRWGLRACRLRTLHVRRSGFQPLLHAGRPGLQALLHGGKSGLQAALHAGRLGLKALLHAGKLCFQVLLHAGRSREVSEHCCTLRDQVSKHCCVLGVGRSSSAIELSEMGEF